MLNNRTIIIFGDDWGRYPSTIQHIGKVLAQYNRLIWIGSLGLRKPEFSLYDVKRVWQKGKQIFQKKENTDSISSSSVVELHPFLFPFHDSNILHRLSMKFVRNAVLHKMNELKVEHPILFTSSPIIAEIVGTLNESSSHYFCLDDFTLFEGAFDSLGRREQKLVEKVDSTFSISEGLLQTRKSSSGHNYFLPQGVDTEHFQPTNNLSLKVKDLAKPIIGFFGLLTSWVDIDLIVQAAIHYPHYTFLILGKSAVDISMFTKAKNIIYLGEIPFAELPNYASAFTVGIIPFIVNELTIACNPLKLLEYLSLGIPVVSTDLPEVRKFSPTVMIAKNNTEFISALEKAVQQYTGEHNKKRRELAERYSWKSITEMISNVVQTIEQKKFNKMKK